MKLLMTFLIFVKKCLYWHIKKIMITHDNTNDVLQITFIKVYKGIHNFKLHSKLHISIYRITNIE